MQKRIIVVWAWLALGPAMAGELVVTVTDQNGRPVADAVAYLEREGQHPPPARGAQAVMDQQDGEFVPHVLPVQTGTAVAFPNSDDVRHHVYSFSKAKRFELPLYKQGGRPTITFDRPGVVPLGCNIHDWMLGYIVVLDTPWFGKSDEAGRARLTGLAPGEYELSVWHPRQIGDRAQQGVRLTDGRAQTGVALRLKADRPRRTDDADYYRTR